MSRLLDALHSGRVLLMDGAMGTELQKAGLRDDENAAAWNLLHPERVRAVHQAYREAGAEVLLTNTFMANDASFWEAVRAAGSTYNMVQYYWTTAAQLIAPPRTAVFRLTSVGPVLGRPGIRNWEAPDSQHAMGLFSKGTDAVLLETWSSPRVRFVLRRIRKWAEQWPCLLSLTYHRNNARRIVTLSGHPPEWFASRATGWGIAALGVNCGRDIGMDQIIQIIRRYRAVTDLPLFARPNAGTPKRKGRRWVYPLTPKAMAARLPELLEAGVSMVGGCCGTTPEHIAALKPVIDAWNARRAP